MVNYSSPFVSVNIGPALEATAYVSSPVAGATTKFSIKVSRDGNPVNTAVVTMQVETMSASVIYPTGPGSVANAAGGTVVTGTATTFLTTFKVGDTITIGAQNAVIVQIASNTSMTTDPILSLHVNSSYSGYSLVPRDTQFAGMYSFIPDSTTIFPTAGQIYKIKWNISNAAQGIYPRLVLPLHHIVVVQEP